MALYRTHRPNPKSDWVSQMETKASLGLKEISLHKSLSSLVQRGKDSLLGKKSPLPGDSSGYHT